MCPDMNLTDRQNDQIHRPASLVPPHRHDAFLENVARVLADSARPSNDDVGRAITLVLPTHGVAASSRRSATTTTTAKEITMSRTQHRIDDDDDELQDGQHLRVPMRLIDQLQRELRDDGDDDAGSHKPGYRITDAQQHDPSVYKTYDDDIETAWQKPPSGGFVGQREGDLCTIDGAPGHLKTINGELSCVPDRERDASSTMDAIYGEYDRSISEQWKGANR
jgi:hypothetical protein